MWSVALESGASESGKIDIHVHVTVRTGGSAAAGAPPQGTLADLKLQRAQQRPPLPPGSAGIPPRPPLPPGVGTAGAAGGGAGAAALDTEVEMKKFVSTVPGVGGVTSEPPHEGTGCCVLQ